MRKKLGSVHFYSVDRVRGAQNNLRSSEGRRCMNAHGFGKNKASSNITVLAEKFP